MKYKFLEHTADVLFEAYGKSLEEAIENSAEAISKTVSDKVKKIEEFEFEESGESLEDLIVKTLQDFLVECEIRVLLPGGLKVIDLDEKEKKIKVRCWCGKGETKTQIKGVTYGMLKVEKNKEWKIRVLLDV
ncbi:MAG: archease [Candidatus Aenigmatarchaeota archaeon]